MVYGFSELRNLKEILKKVLSPGFKLLLKIQRVFLNILTRINGLL